MSLSISAMKTYKANKNGLMKYLMIGYAIFMGLIFMLDTEVFSERSYLFLPLLLPCFLGLWLLWDTYYQIDGGKLRYRSGFFRGQIEIKNIKEILKGRTRWIGLKPALTTGGIIIKYNRFDDIYLAPESNEELIADLLKVNADISVR